MFDRSAALGPVTGRCLHSGLGSPSSAIHAAYRNGPESGMKKKIFQHKVVVPDLTGPEDQKLCKELSC
ncbi:hypothetical protein NDU88_006208 [Pleurodeles waltl]|uniref:Uncharacterized protein n=1 Tax=Pleurodeles waltl TaxID=8319 RepID=A0AAV7TWH2_PLEWA|nr:hypothetical protein NDU88_006208 [Pleurodeles waltl]